MPASIFAVVYGTASKAGRRVVVADTDDEVLLAQGRLQPGESILFLNHVDHPTDKRIRACMVEIAAKIAPNGESVLQMRSVVVQGGIVVDVRLADPAIDTVPHAGAQLIQHDLAAIGDQWGGTHFVRRTVFSDHIGNSATPQPMSALTLETVVFPPPQRSA